MGRPGIPIGERGAISDYQFDDGNYRARCFYRDSGGTKRELPAHAPNKGKATTLLKSKWHRESKDILNGRLGGEQYTFGQVFDHWYKYLRRKSLATGKPKLRTINDDYYMVKNHVLP